MLSLPYPDVKTFKYATYLIGPGLRPENPERCLTPDMCAPIYPNTFHPSGEREALKPRTPFPYSNCYHWFGGDMRFDIRIWNDDRTYTKEERVSLPPDQLVDLDDLHSDDVSRAFSARMARDDALRAEGTPSEEGMPQEQGQADNSDPADSDKSSPDAEDQEDVPSSPDSPIHYCESVCGSDSGCSSLSYDPPSEGVNRSSEALAQADIFGLDFGEREELFPIVKVWDDVGAHFKDDDVPNPMEFAKQYDEIVRYVLWMLVNAGCTHDADRIIAESKARTRILHAAERREKKDAWAGLGGMQRRWQGEPQSYFASYFLLLISTCEHKLYFATL